MPMINEAICALVEGVGTPEAIDTVMKLRMNQGVVPPGPVGGRRDGRRHNGRR